MGDMIEIFKAAVRNRDNRPILTNANINLALDGHSFIAPPNSLSSTIYYQLSPYKYYNGAVAGTTIANSKTRAAVLDTQLVVETPTYKNVLVVYSGVNDVTNTAGTGLTAYNLFKTYVQDRVTAGWKVFAFTITPSIFSGRGSQFKIERGVFNGNLRTDLSTIAGVYILDTDTIAALNDAADTNYYTDGLHPARLSVNLMSTLLLTKLNQIYHSVSVPYVDHATTLTITKDGLGTAVSTLILYSAQKMTITLDGAAKFYSDAAGTLNESSSWNMAGLAAETRYIRCTDGTCNLVIPNNEITYISNWSSPTNAPKIGGDISNMTSLIWLQTADKNTLSGSVANLRFLNTVSTWNTSLITFEDLSKLQDLSNLSIGISPVLTSAQINHILADIILNKDTPKSQATRVLYLMGNFGTGAPTGQGITDKGILAGYKSPNNTGPSYWTVTTR